LHVAWNKRTDIAKEVNGMIELDQYRQELANIRERITQAGESL